MIPYRQHVVSLVAVFLALAVGVALGGGPLSELGRAEPAAPARTASATPDRTASFGHDFATEVGPALYGDRLAGHPVSLLTMPGADERDVEALVAEVTAAGAGIAGRYDLREGLVDPGEKTLVDTLGSQLAQQLGASEVAVDAPTYVRMGQLLGAAVASPDPAGEPPSASSATVRESLVAGELVTVTQDPVRQAPLVLVVLGDEVEGAVLAGLASGLASTATGVVVAGGTRAGRSGDLAALRADPAGEEVSTVDGVDGALGRVTAVLALLRELGGTGGSFGASGSDGAVPLG